jgi:Zn-dependent protease
MPMLSFLVPFRMHRDGWVLVAACILMGVWFNQSWLGVGLGLLLIASLLLHELGHMIVATALGVQVKEFGLKMIGAYNRRSYSDRRRNEILISFAGPLANILAAFPALLVPHIGVQLALCNLLLGVCNLIPFPASDGLRILKTFVNSEPPAVVAGLSHSRVI